MPRLGKFAVIAAAAAVMVGVPAGSGTAGPVAARRASLRPIAAAAAPADDPTERI